MKVRCEKDGKEFVASIFQGHDTDSKRIICPKCMRSYYFNVKKRQWISDIVLTIKERK